MPNDTTTVTNGSNGQPLLDGWNRFPDEDPPRGRCTYCYATQGDRFYGHGGFVPQDCPACGAVPGGKKPIHQEQVAETYRVRKEAAADRAAASVSVAQPLTLTESQAADQLAGLLKGKHLFVRPKTSNEKGEWFNRMANGVWRIDGDGYAVRSFIKYYLSSEESRSNQRAVQGTWKLLELCEGVTAEDDHVWNADPHLLGTRSGIIDLRTGQPYEGPDPYVSFYTRVAPGPEGAELWAQCLAEWTGNNPDLQRDLQRMAGAFLHGRPNKRFYVLHGPGNSGKNSFIEAIQFALGGYAITSKPALVTGRSPKSGGADPGLSRLEGRRLAVVAELTDDSQFNVSRIKRMTGDKWIAGRALWREESEFRQSATICIHTNTISHSKDVGTAMRDRLVIIPFSGRFDPDPELQSQLEAAAPAVLQWMLDGYAERDQLVPGVREAAYWSEQDPVGEWAKDALNYDFTGFTSSSDLLKSFQAYEKDSGADPISDRLFFRQLSRIGFKRAQKRLNGKKTKGWEGPMLDANCEGGTVEPF